MLNKEKICYDKMNLGYCTKGTDCQVCNSSRDYQSQVIDPNLLSKLNLGDLNVNAKTYVPKSKQQQQTEKLDLNLSAKEYLPKSLNNDMEPDDIEEDAEDEFDMIMRDIIENEVVEECESESDDERWFPNYKNCECCKGFVYKCKGVACENLGMCYCKMREDCDDEDI
jgi:hypothetical protein